MTRSIAYRRHQRQRALAKAKRVVSHVWSQPWKPYWKYADDLCICSCEMCNSGDPHAHRQFKQADERDNDWLDEGYTLDPEDCGPLPDTVVIDRPRDFRLVHMKYYVEVVSHGRTVACYDTVRQANAFIDGVSYCRNGG